MFLIAVERFIGEGLGLLVGFRVGCFVGLYDGVLDGFTVLLVGADVGNRVGFDDAMDGLRVGINDGLRVGINDGLEVGMREGVDGLVVGITDRSIFQTDRPYVPAYSILPFKYMS